MFAELYYRSLAKEHPWAEHLTSLPKGEGGVGGGGGLASVSKFNHERARMSCLQRLPLEANKARPT